MPALSYLFIIDELQNIALKAKKHLQSFYGQDFLWASKQLVGWQDATSVDVTTHVQ